MDRQTPRADGVDREGRLLADFETTGRVTASEDVVFPVPLLLRTANKRQRSFVKMLDDMVKTDGGRGLIADDMSG